MKQLTVVGLILSLVLTNAAIAGTSSAGGVLRPADPINCTYKNQKGYEVSVVVEANPTSQYYIATVQQSTLNGLYAPLTFQRISLRSQGSVSVYQGKGFYLSVDYATGLDIIPPLYDGVLSAKDVSQGRPLPVKCQNLN